MSKNLSDIPANLAGGSAVTIDPMTTRGDIIVRDSSNVTDRLPVGTNGQILKSDGVDVSWDDADSGSGKNYTLNPSAAADDTTGVAFDTGFSVARTTTASELPEESIGSAFNISGSSLTIGTSKVAFAILASGIDDADGGRFGRAKVSVKDISGSINGQYSIQVYDVTNSVYVGDEDTITGTGTYILDVPFIAEGDYEFHLIAQNANPSAIGLSSITVEPVSQTWANLGGWKTYKEDVVSFTNTSGFSNATCDLIPYKDPVNNTWRLKGNIVVTATGNVASVVFSIDGVTIADTRSGSNPFYAGAGMTNQGQNCVVYFTDTSGSITIRDYVTSTQYFTIIIDVPLDDKPTWADWDNTAPTASDVQYANARGRWYRNASYTSTANAEFAFDTESTLLENTGITNTAGVFTVAQPGTYQVTSSLRRTTNLSATYMQLYKNGSAAIIMSQADGTRSINGSVTVTLAAGDTIGVALTAAITANVSDDASWIEIVRVSDYSARKASLPFSDVADDTKQYLLPDIRVSGEGDLGTITNWATVDSKKYRWHVVGKMCFFEMRAESTTASTSHLYINITIPSDVPQPSSFSPGADSEWQLAANGFRSAALDGAGLATSSGIYLVGGEYKLYTYVDVAQASKIWTASAFWRID